MACVLGLLLSALLLLCELFTTCKTIPAWASSNQALSYSREALLSLCHYGDRPTADPFVSLIKNLPEDIRAPRRQRLRKRGRRGGIRQRLRRRGNRPPLPSMILSNARSLRNKMDELRLLTRGCFEYRESCIMLFTKTWLHPEIPDCCVDIEGFSHIRSDRSELSGKSKGGGLCLYINDKWCRQHTVREKICNPDVEFLCVSLRPFYLPREFGNILICSVYVPPNSNASRAAAQVADCVHEQLQRTPNAPIFIMGDLNHCNLNTALAGFEQYIKCDTRKNRTLDKCYGNVKHAYTAIAKPPLSNSDHNTVHLIPTYKTALKSSKPLVKSINAWTDDSIETLKGCFLCTDWDTFSGEPNLDNATEVTTDYIKFCVDTVIPKMTIKVYPNNKPYITKEVKDCINRKKQAFKTNDHLQLKTVQKELNQRLKEAREHHREAIEENLQAMNSKKTMGLHENSHQHETHK